VQVTAPLPPVAALRTANLAEMPSDGALAANAEALEPSSAAIPINEVDRYIWRFMCAIPFGCFSGEHDRSAAGLCPDACKRSRRWDFFRANRE
jgi:hypothetical protein